jgi:WD40 repeat protein
MNEKDSVEKNKNLEESQHIQKFDKKNFVENVKTIWETSFIFSVAIIDDITIASGSVDGIIKIWDIKADGTLIRKIDAHEKWISSIVSLNDNRLASTSNDSENAIKIWNLSDGKLIRKYVLHTGIIWSMVMLKNGLLGKIKRFIIAI